MAYTNNHVNCLVDGDTVFTASSHGPVVDYDSSGTASDILGDYVSAMFARAGYTAITQANEVYYHNRLGSIHCGTNARRVAPTYEWWTD